MESSSAALTKVMWTAIDRQMSSMNKEKIQTNMQKHASCDEPLHLLMPKEGLTLSEIYLYFCMTSKPNRTKLEKS